MIRMSRLLILLPAMLAACATTERPAYKLYPGPERTSSELAEIRFGDHVCNAVIDGLAVNCGDYVSVLLEPGLHRVSLDATFPVSVMVNPDMWDTLTLAGDIDLAPGRTYLLIGDRTTGYGYEMWAWVEDADSGEVFTLEYPR